MARGEPVWVMLNHSVDEFYLFDRRSDGIGALEPTGTYTDQNCPPTRPLCRRANLFEDWLRDDLNPAAQLAILANSPCQIVMAINEGDLAQQLVRCGKCTFHLMSVPFCELSTRSRAAIVLQWHPLCLRDLLCPFSPRINPLLNGTTLTNDAAG